MPKVNERLSNYAHNLINHIGVHKTFYYVVGGLVVGCFVGYVLPNLLQHDLSNTESSVQIPSQVRNITSAFGGLTGLVSGFMAKSLNDAD